MSAMPAASVVTGEAADARITFRRRVGRVSTCGAAHVGASAMEGQNSECCRTVH